MKKRIKASTLITTGIVVTTAIAGGLAVGIVFGKLMSQHGENIEDITIEPGLEDDYDALMKKYAEDKDIKNYRYYELVNISWLKFGQEEHTHTVSHGIVNANVVKQKIFAHDVRDGDKFFNESLSYSGIKTCGVRFFQTEEGVETYWATGVKENGTATWSENKKEDHSLLQHEEKWGKTLDRPVIYIISSTTVLKESMAESAGGYIIDLDLDPKLSVKRYVKQMVSISNLDSVPTFKSVHLHFEMDADLNIKTFVADEAYTVYVVGKNDSSSTLTQEFYHNSDEKIPDLHENYNY